MENKTNKILELSDGKKYIVIRQIFYKNTTYFVSGELLNNESDLTGNVVLFEETKDNDKTILKSVVDPHIMKIIYEHLDKTENN